MAADDKVCEHYLDFQGFMRGFAFFLNYCSDVCLIVDVFC